jgi:hypothetical protein
MLSARRLRSAHIEDFKVSDVDQRRVAGVSGSSVTVRFGSAIYIYNEHRMTVYAKTVFLSCGPFSWSVEHSKPRISHGQHVHDTLPTPQRENVGRRLHVRIE